jgi:hypothetical protein
MRELRVGHAFFHVRRRIGRVRLVFNANRAHELHLAQRLEHRGNVQYAFRRAEHHVFFPLVIVVLQVHPEVAVAHDPDLLGRIELLAQLGHADQVPRIEAGADQLVMVLHRLHDDLGGPPLVSPLPRRPMRMDRDRDLVFVHELVEAVECVAGRAGAEVFQAAGPAEIEEFPVSVVILGEAGDAEADGRHVVFLAQRENALEFLGR